MKKGPEQAVNRMLKAVEEMENIIVWLWNWSSYDIEKERKYAHNGKALHGGDWGDRDERYYRLARNVASVSPWIKQINKDADEMRKRWEGVNSDLGEFILDTLTEVWDRYHITVYRKGENRGGRNGRGGNGRAASIDHEEGEG